MAMDDVAYQGMHLALQALRTFRTACHTIPLSVRLADIPKASVPVQKESWITRANTELDPRKFHNAMTISRRPTAHPEGKRSLPRPLRLLVGSTKLIRTLSLEA